MPTKDVDVVNNITEVDMGTQDVYEVWSKDVSYNLGEIDHINNDVKVTEKLALGGVTATKWDHPLKVIPEVTTETKVSPTGTG